MKNLFLPSAGELIYLSAAYSWHMMKLEPEVVFHFSQKRMCGCFPHRLVICACCLPFSPFSFPYVYLE